MGKTPGISAFFPCFNDGATIAGVVLLADVTLRQLTGDYEILVIDDGSTDHSRAILRDLERRVERLKVILHDGNRDYGAVLRTGFAAAGKEYVFYTDGDFQYDVSELPKLFAAMRDGTDVVNGYRRRRADPPVRKLTGRMYQWAMRLLFGLRLRDIDCDFRLFRRSAFDGIRLTNASPAICVEMLRKLRDRGCRFAEVPVSHHPRSHGRSQFFYAGRIYRNYRDIFRFWWHYVVRGRKTWGQAVQ